MSNVILFDLDGTLIDSNELIIKTFKYVFKTALKDVLMKDEDYIPFIGPTLYQSFSQFTDDPVFLDELVNLYRQQNIQLHDQMIKPFEGAQTLLKNLKLKGYKIGIVSSKINYLVKRGLRICGLEPYVDLVIGSDDVVKHKPDKEPICKAMDYFQVKEAIYIGDHPNDILAGKNANIKTIGVLYSLLKEALIEANADYYVHNLLEIEEVILCMMSS